MTINTTRPAMILAAFALFVHASNPQAGSAGRVSDLMARLDDLVATPGRANCVSRAGQSS